MNVTVQTLKEATFTQHIVEDVFGKVGTPVLITDSKEARTTSSVKNPGVTKQSIHFER